MTEFVFILDRSGSIHHIGSVHKHARKEDVPEKTLFIISADGMENVSRHYDYRKVKEMIGRQKSKYGWEFLFLGANIDAAREAARFGIAEDKAVTYSSDSRGTQLNYDVIADAVSDFRAAPSCRRTVSAGWKKRIDEDMKQRGK